MNRTFRLYTDASREGLGAILAQVDVEGYDRVIVYANRALRKYELNNGITDLELLAIIRALGHFRPYLLGAKFTIVTDHSANGFLLRKVPSTPVSTRQVRWTVILSEYDYNVLFRKGQVHQNADALSRQPFVQPRDPKTKEVFGPAEWKKMPRRGDGRAWL